MRRAIEAIQDSGIEVDIWKIEGVDERDDAAMLAEQARSGEGREGVTCVLLGRGASTEKVEQWLEAAAPVDGFIGFAIGRSIWWDALKGFLAEELDARGGSVADRRQLPAFRRGLRGPAGRTEIGLAAGDRAARRHPPSTRLVGSAPMAMKMRQSLAQLEQEFRHETQLDRSRRETLRRQAVRRSRKRTHEREQQAQLGALLAARAVADRDRGDRHRGDVRDAVPTARLSGRPPVARAESSAPAAAGSAPGLRYRYARLAEPAQRRVDLFAGALAGRRARSCWISR